MKNLGLLFLKQYFFLKEILAALSFYRLRLFFSILSVALGIGTIVLIVGATDGANKRVSELFEMFGPDAILVISGGRKTILRGRKDTLTWKDVKSIKNNIPGVYEVVPMDIDRGIVKYKNKKWLTSIVGTTPAYFSSWQWYPQEGVIFTQRDVEEKRAVCVIGIEVKKELFPHTSPLGKYILVKRLPVQVIGVLKERGTSTGHHHLDDRIIMPITTLMQRLLNDDKYITLLRVRTHDDLKQTEGNIRALLRYNHKLGPLAQDDFDMFSAAEVKQILQVISGSLLLFLGSAGLIALIVGGFILANLSYLSIRQRRREIGIKRACGAKKINIAASFLLEILLTTLLGGIVGVGLALGGGVILERFGQIPMIFSAKIWELALGLSLLVGLTFGLRPALKAASIDPIKAIKG